ncbi:POTRA domain-containing protein, FtsQ-type [Rubritalea squalenifaciens DSM 18772]|uniref:POTRA domain-containing protein, FtsQ-type n=2 Tax=Rubritalea squalenifaciens TaxID=407226 RepID=A0A1M6M2K9_9BACT|nr:POTRA domain-containing protein, FtsQ-type [Rubritalea squalenifaciens DSM 18772]
MFKKKTTRVKNRSDRKLHLQVSSPRIVFFQSIRALQGMIKLVAVLIIVGIGVYLGGRAIRDHFVNNEEFLLRELSLETNGYLTYERVVEIGEINLNGTIFEVDIDELEQKLMDRPEVVTATVERKMPGKIEVKLQERVPVAWVSCRQLGLAGRNPLSGILMDEDGVVFQCQGDLWNVAKDLPVFELPEAEEGAFQLGEKMNHKEAERALSLLNLINSKLGEEADWAVSRITVLNFHSMMVTSTDHVDATFDMYDHERQLSDLLDARRHARETGRELAWINLLPRHNIPGGFKGENGAE